MKKKNQFAFKKLIVFALLKVKGDAGICNNCQACTKMCPMNIRIPDYTQNGQRVLSTECSLCQTCITVCPRDALGLSFGLDVGGKELLRQRVDAPGQSKTLPGQEVIA
jgi:ferredoxin